MKTLFLPLLLLALTGCLKNEPSTATSNEETVVQKADRHRVYTVTELLAQPELRKKLFAICTDDPGRMERDPNCVNTLSAERAASVGRIASTPRIVP